jgi:hypothetical protein
MALDKYLNNLAIVLFTVYVGVGSYYTHKISNFDESCNYVFAYLLMSVCFYFVVDIMAILRRCCFITIHMFIEIFMTMVYCMLFIVMTYYDSVKDRECTNIVDHHNGLWIFLIISICTNCAIVMLQIVRFVCKLVQLICCKRERLTDNIYTIVDN